MNLNEDKAYEEAKNFEPPKPPEQFNLWKATCKYVYVGVACFVLGLIVSGVFYSNLKARNRDLSAENRELKKALENVPAETTIVPVETESIKTIQETAPVTNAPAENAGTYMNNDYYDVVETATFKNSINDTVVIHKVLAKKDVSVTGTLLAFEDDASTVIGKSTDDIILTAGQYNFFRYTFDGDVTDSPIQPSSQVQQDSVMVGERNAVEMVTYNQNERHLYITFKQNADELGSFAKFKLLFYKDDKIVDTEDGYFTAYANNLNGNGSSDVVKLRDCSEEYDRFEYIFEP